MVTFYVYPSEIKKALEIMTSVYPLKGRKYFLQFSGVRLTYNPNRMLFDRVTEIWIGDEEEGYKPLDYSEANKTLYRVGADIYNATFLKVIGRFTWNILDIVPKDRNGNPIQDLKTARVDADKSAPGLQELKAWKGLLEYIRSFKDVTGDGIPDMPDKYRGRLGRNNVQASWNPYQLLRRGTYVTWSAFLALLIVLALALLVIRVVLKRFVR